MKTSVKQHLRKGRLVHFHTRVLKSFVSAKQKKGYYKHYFDTELTKDELKKQPKDDSEFWIKNETLTNWEDDLEAIKKRQSKSMMVKKKNVNSDDRERWLDDAIILQKDAQKLRQNAIKRVQQANNMFGRPDVPSSLRISNGLAFFKEGLRLDREADVKEKASKEALDLAEEL
jgi:hypothetical protein